MTAQVCPAFGDGLGDFNGPIDGLRTRVAHLTPLIGIGDRTCLKVIQKLKGNFNRRSIDGMPIRSVNQIQVQSLLLYALSAWQISVHNSIKDK